MASDETNTPQNASNNARPRTWNAFKGAWRKRSDNDDAKLHTVQRQFLPAALEVQETPPSPTPHWLLWLLIILFSLSVLWACFGEVDVVVTAPGRIVPSGQVKIVQAPESGTVLSIHVHEGQRVTAGQTLISLDATYAEADALRIHRQLDNTTLQIAWRQALEHWLEGDRGEVPALSLPQSSPDSDRLRIETLYDQQRAEISARIESLERDLNANRAGQHSAEAQKEQAQATLQVLQERVAAYKALLDKEYGAKVQYLELLQQQTELERSIPVLASREQQLIETAAAIRARINANDGELRKSNLMELVRLNSERAALEQESRKAALRQQQQVLIAPVTGTVQELALHTIGGVVTPAQTLMKIIPEGVTIEAEALLQNKDIGFVNEGQVAEVKINTFNFTKYGLIDAKVADISNDAVEDKQLGWVFKMRLQLEQEQIAVEQKWVKLSPGMAVTIEIKTGKRRLIEFFLSPLLRYKQESIRER